MDSEDAEGSEGLTEQEILVLKTAVLLWTAAVVSLGLVLVAGITNVLSGLPATIAFGFSFSVRAFTRERMADVPDGLRKMFTYGQIAAGVASLVWVVAPLSASAS